jgi:primosomal protein N' (replication factor Y) (superfamily II helicase)
MTLSGSALSYLGLPRTSGQRLFHGRQSVSSLLQCRMPVTEGLPSLPDQTLLYADVIVPRHIAQPFTYLVPRELTHRLKIGQRVLVPFGRAALEAVVIALSRQRPAALPSMPLKEIRTLLSSEEETALFEPLLELSRQVADEYVAPWGQCLRLIFPPSRGVSTTMRYVATEEGRAVLKAGQCPAHLEALLKRIARRSNGVLATTVLQSAGRGAANIIEALTSQAWITVTAVNGTEGSRKNDGTPADKPAFGRLPEQHDARLLPQADPALLTRLVAGLEANESRKIVVQGPWDHRLTVLLRAVQQAHAVGKSSLIITGETGRASWLAGLLAKKANLPVTLLRAGQAGLSIFGGSDLQAGESAPSIVVGTRSALFVPLRMIGFIWIDREDDSALKELQEPRYHAREVACLRGAIEKTLVVLASSHPSLESIENVSAELHALPEDPGRRPLIEVVDLRLEPAGTVLSQKLRRAMRDALDHQAGVLLFLNRKGFAGALVCRECGWLPRCPACAVALTYYRDTARLGCRYCGMADLLPETCPACQASRLAPVGEGTERAELEARRLFPQAKLARLDGETLRRPAAARALWKGVRSGAFDIVVGTQALFGGEPLPCMGLVGVLQADSGLHVPDFRAAERTYQLLMDAGEVARPMADGGRMIVQTFMPTHHAIESFVSNQPGRFYEEELAGRRLLGYPPACHLVSLSVLGREMLLVQTAAGQWRRRVEQSAGGSHLLMMLGPVPSLGSRPKGQHRYHILAKGHDRELLLKAVSESVQAMEREYKRRELKFVVDVDPVDMS